MQVSGPFDRTVKSPCVLTPTSTTDQINRTCEILRRRLRLTYRFFFFFYTNAFLFSRRRLHSYIHCEFIVFEGLFLQTFVNSNLTDGQNISPTRILLKQSTSWSESGRKLYYVGGSRRSRFFILILYIS